MPVAMPVDIGLAEPQRSLSAAMLAADGVIARNFKGFFARPAQQQMASLVEQAIDQRQSLLIEAAAGSGKTLAYLVPMIINKQQAIISTASHYLQNQLYQQDIPQLQQALGSARSVAMLKGRSNYLCPYYVEKALASDSKLAVEIRRSLASLWARFRHSDSAQLDQLLGSDNTKLRSYASCSAEACLGSGCPKFDQCPLMRARQRAQQADIVVVNHSVLFADQQLRREQFGVLLPRVKLLVVDEVHRLGDFAHAFAGDSVSSYQLKRFCRDANQIIEHCAPQQRAALDFLRQLQRAIAQLTAHTPTVERYQSHQHRQLLAQLISGVQRFAQLLDHFVDRDHQLRELAIRTDVLIQILRRIEQSSGLCWVEPTAQGFILQNIPLSVASRVQELIAATRNSSWIFTSATCTVGGSPERFLQLLALPPEAFTQLSPTMDYQRNARLYTPQLAVEPAHADYGQALASAALPLIEAVQGRSLFLFTSYELLRQLAQILQDQLTVPMFVQGTADNSQLIAQFKAAPAGVLLGTGSFWEGLDLSGVPLSLVIIDKLPFAAPDQPLVKLRIDELRSHGVNSFNHYQLPEAVIRLRQGCGRLLRRVSDRGVIMIADPRLHSRSYGDIFIASLPLMQRLASTAAVIEFLTASPQENDEDTGP